MRRSDGLQKAVLLREATKKSFLSNHRGKVTNLVEKIHCIMVYYCVKDSLQGVSEIHICNDADFRTIKRLLPRLFDGYGYFKDINITARKRSEPSSQGHWPALKAHRKRKNATLLIKESMIEEKLLEFR